MAFEREKKEHAKKPGLDLGETLANIARRIDERTAALKEAGKGTSGAPTPAKISEEVLSKCMGIANREFGQTAMKKLEKEIANA